MHVGFGGKTMPYEAHLSRSLLPSSLFSLPLTSAGVQTSRLAIKDRNSVYFATGQSVLQVHLDEVSGRITQDYTALSSDYLIPDSCAGAHVSAVVPHSAHRAEITSVAADGDRLASIDAYGACVVTVGLPDGKPSITTLHPPSVSSAERGWSGVALKTGDMASVATARQYYRDIHLYDAGVLARSIHALAEPAGITFLDRSSRLAVLEGPALVLYDLRSPLHAACTSRKSPSSSHLQAVDTSADGFLIAVAGKDRTVHVFDTRTLSFQERWSSCLKYECAGLRMSRQLEGMVYACSVDNEVACGIYCSRVAEMVGPGTTSLMMSGASAKSSRRVFGFRGDVRLMGMDSYHDDAGEIVVAVSEFGSLYVLEVR
jgi:hypothetical protein